MSYTKKPHYFPSGISDEIVAKHVSAALRREHAGISAAVKHVERITGIPAKTASKWYNGEYAPKSRHLIALSLHYPEVLQAVLELMGAERLWQEAVNLRLPDTMRSRLSDRWEKWKKSPMERDKFVLIRVHVDAQIAMQLNQRQLWFLGQLQQGYKLHAGSLVDTWRIHVKTARRDIEGLLKTGLIQVFRNGNQRWYELLERQSWH